MGLNIKDLKIASPAFGFGEQIPKQYTSDGDDVSPPLEISGVPEGTASLAVICHDPDAPLPHGHTHWVLYAIPPDVRSIPEGGGDHYAEGDNEDGNRGYGGPAPPQGHGPHHYYFHVYALDEEIGVAPALTRKDLLDRMEGHIIEQNRLVGIYER